ncbi:hypothetical protein RJT34_23667 [Clitoria ternatea]|uniref:Uncharacterized protein n=1 Tax=Clitoria ternatea TaxID=43366 RepID=A0AAN9IF64_CLITE
MVRTLVPVLKVEQKKENKHCTSSSSLFLSLPLSFLSPFHVRLGFLSLFFIFLTFSSVLWIFTVEAFEASMCLQGFNITQLVKKWICHWDL